VTEIIGPAFYNYLRKNKPQTIDAADQIFSLFGRSVHAILEASETDENNIVEKRFFKDYEINGKLYKLGGKIDLYEGQRKQLSDFKVTSIFKINEALSGKVPEEWIWQLNILRLLMKSNCGIDVNSLSITGIARDWRESERRDYIARSPISAIHIPILDCAKVEAFIIERLTDHITIKSRLGQVTECSKEERWERPPKYAAIKEGGKRALKLFDSNEDANAWLEKQNDKDMIKLIDRPGRRTRCERYCPVNMHCPGYIKYIDRSGDKNEIV
jgi:hypothetical protein